MKSDLTTSKLLSSFHVSHPSKSFGIKALVALILVTAVAVFAVAAYNADFWYSKPVQMVPDHRLPSPSPPPSLLR